METLSERYGWTPDEIRAMKMDDIDDYLKIISLRNQEKERIHKQAMAKSRKK